MRRFQSMFIRVRGRLRKRTCIAASIVSTSRIRPMLDDASLLREWAPWLAWPGEDIGLFRERMASRLARDAGIETLRTETGSDWSELLAQRKKEIDGFREFGLSPRHLRPGVRVPALNEGEVIRTVGADWADLLRQREDEIRATRPDLLKSAVSPSSLEEFHPAARPRASYSTIVRAFFRRFSPLRLLWHWDRRKQR